MTTTQPTPHAMRRVHLLPADSAAMAGGSSGMMSKPNQESPGGGVAVEGVDIAAGHLSRRFAIFQPPQITLTPHALHIQLHAIKAKLAGYHATETVLRGMLGKEVSK